MKITTIIMAAIISTSAAKEAQIDKAAVESVKGLNFINMAGITRKADFFKNNRGRSFVAYIRNDTFPRPAIGYGKTQWRISGKASVHGIYRFSVAPKTHDVSIGALVTSDKNTARAIAQQNK